MFTASIISNNWLYRTVLPPPSSEVPSRVRDVPSDGGNTKLSETNAQALMTPSSSFVKFPAEMAAPVAQGAWLGSRDVPRERVRRCRGRRGASVRRSGWEESGSGTAAMRRGRRGTPLRRAHICETPRMHGASSSPA